jgi:hypothetical protein
MAAEAARVSDRRRVRGAGTGQPSPMRFQIGEARRELDDVTIVGTAGRRRAHILEGMG